MSRQQAVDDWQVFEINAMRPLRLVNRTGSDLELQIQVVRNGALKLQEVLSE